MPSLLRNFWLYQRKRFPLIVLLCTTSAVVFSSASVIGVSVSEYPVRFAAAIFLGLALLLNMRVQDDVRDFQHDNKFHADRPVQQHQISLQQLRQINRSVLLLSGLLLISQGFVPSMYGLLSFGFSWLAGQDFFAGQRFKQFFLLYNAANFLQMVWLQLLLYIVLEPSIRITSGILWLHFAFVIANAFILEIARKIKSPALELPGNDTYSWRFGFAGALWFYLLATVLSALLYFWTAATFTHSIATPFCVALVAILIAAAAAGWYFVSRRASADTLLQITAIGINLSLHVSLYLH